jgi:hypothetical protein
VEAKLKNMEETIINRRTERKKQQVTKFLNFSVSDATGK